MSDIKLAVAFLPIAVLTALNHVAGWVMDLSTLVHGSTARVTVKLHGWALTSHPAPAPAALHAAPAAVAGPHLVPPSAPPPPIVPPKA